MTQDVLSGNWKEQRYETSRAASMKNANWFTLEAFAKRVAAGT